MSFLNYKKKICDEIEKVLGEVNQEELGEFIHHCDKARRIMLIGKGRVGIVLKAFSMRLNAMGKESCVLDEITTFHMTPEDLLILGNMTGDAEWADYYLNAAHSVGATVFYVTSLDGRESAKADGVLHIRARAYGAPEKDNYKSCQPMSSTAEQCVWFVMDAVSQVLSNSAEEDSLREIFKHMLEDMRKNVLDVNETEIDRLISEIDKREAKCFCGTGRSGLILKSFAMRLYHMGYNVYICGETGWRSPGKEDVLVACSNHGKEKIVFPYVEAASVAGALVMCISSNYETSQQEAFSLFIPDESSKRSALKCDEEFPFSEDAFNHALYVTLDYAVYKMMVLHNWVEGDLAKRHTNIS